MSANINVIHDDIKLYTSADRFFLEPTINPQEILILDRITSEATVLERIKVQLPVPASVYRPVCGFLGTVKLLAGTYLVVATHRIQVGKLNGQDVYQLAGADLIPFSRSETHLNQKQIEDNESYIRMMKSVLETPGIYFSYSYDLTHTLQRLQEAGQDFPQMSLLVRADPRFVWNGHLLKGYRDKQFARFSLPIIQGFVSINSVIVEAKEFVWALVSRRSVQRAGTRLFTRGIDSQGYVANYVETEQLVERDGQQASFVQTRGSVPLYWRQLPDLSYKPVVEVSAADHVAAYTRHLADQIQRYGAQVLVNLIDQRGKEEALERAYRSAVAASGLPRVRYEAFDFHAECRAMRYDRLSVLIDRISHEQDEFAYFMSRNGVTLAHQTGVFRTNCVDCLDRTNVVQSLLARRALTSALRVIGVLRGEGSVERCTQLEALFKGVWADHADMISVQYSGTGALKTDYTRTGKRTKLGLMNDGVNSLTRYYKNNFCDGFRQDSIDLFLGNYTVSDGEGVMVPCPLRKNKDWKYTTFPSVLLVAASMFCASVILPSEYSKEILLYLLFWGAMVGTTLSFIFRYGKEFVDYPKLEHSPNLRAVNTSASGL